MNRTTLGMLALGCLLAFGSGTSRADLITFDNLPTGQPIPAGYGGLAWHNVQVVNAVQFGVVPVSGPNALFTFDGNASKGPAWITPAGMGEFTFVGADFAGLDTGVLIKATGFRDGNQVYTASFTIPNHAFSFNTLNFQNIDRLQLDAFQPNAPPGVIPSPGYLIDSFTTGAQTAPEPGSLLLFGIGMAATGLAAFRQRRLKASPD